MELNDEMLFGDIWERPSLSKRDRRLMTVAALVALYRTNEFPFHLAHARENGISKLARFPTILEDRITDERAVPPGELINNGVREMPRPIVIRSLETATR